MRKHLIIIIQLISTLTVFGEIKLPSIISDNMVLQQQADVLLWEMLCQMRILFY